MVNAIHRHIVHRLHGREGSSTLYRIETGRRRKRASGKAVRIPGVEFVRRFSLHILPKGFTRIRHYGLLAPANVNTRWLQADAQLAAAASAHPTAQHPDGEVPRPDDGAEDVLAESAVETGDDVLPSPCGA